MQIDGFYEERTKVAPPWEDMNATETVLRHELLPKLRSGPLPGDDDLETAITLVRIVHSDLERYGTGGGEMFTDDQIEIAQRCLRAVLERHGITLRLPWRNFTDFRSYWLRNDGYNSWQARREILDGFFKPVQEELDRLEESQFRAIVAGYPLTRQPGGLPWTRRSPNSRDVSGRRKRPRTTEMWGQPRRRRTRSPRPNHLRPSKASTRGRDSASARQDQAASRSLMNKPSSRVL